MAEDDIENILSDLDKAYEGLKAARTRLAELLPMSATQPGESGQARVEFVTGLSSDTEGGDDEARRINAEVWEQAQAALITAQQQVEIAHRELRRRLEEAAED
jgi:hypothetical protein